MNLPEKEYFHLYEIAKRWNCDLDLIFHYFEIGILLPSINCKKLPAGLWKGKNPGNESESKLTEVNLIYTGFAYLHNYSLLDEEYVDEVGPVKILNGAILTNTISNHNEWFRVNPERAPTYVISSENIYVTKSERNRFEKEYNISIGEPHIIKTNTASSVMYVDKTRLNELNSIENKDYDLVKLIKLCHELNSSFLNNNLFATAMIIRAILDHVPPIFKCKNFSEVCNNYSGTKSFKESMTNLNNSSRKISDQHLHSQIRKKEVLPTNNQVNFMADLDVLLAEVVRLLK